ncbi:MAG: DMT family transporter [Sphingomonadales bacterium]|mgnify:CR=1 FL=1
MSPYMFLAIAIVAEVIATCSLKLSIGFTKILPSTFVVLGYGCSFYALSQSLKSLQVGFTYPVWCGVGIILVALIGVLFMGERVDWPGVAGMSLIIAGVVVMSVYSKMGGAA